MFFLRPRGLICLTIVTATPKILKISKFSSWRQQQKSNMGKCTQHHSSRVLTPKQKLEHIVNSNFMSWHRRVTMLLTVFLPNKEYRGYVRTKSWEEMREEETGAWRIDKQRFQTLQVCSAPTDSRWMRLAGHAARVAFGQQASWRRASC